MVVVVVVVVVVIYCLLLLYVVIGLVDAHQGKSIFHAQALLIFDAHNPFSVERFGLSLFVTSKKRCRRTSRVVPWIRRISEMDP